MNIIDALVLAAPYFKQIQKEDIMIGVTDKDIFHYYAPAEKIDLGLEKGSPIPPEDPTLHNALRGRKTINRLPAEIYGYTIISVGIPVYGDHGEIVGALAIAYTLENEEKLQELTQNIDMISSRLIDMVQSIATQSEELSTTSAQILTNSRQAVEDSQQVNKVASFIREISDQTNLLGLNAAIEAARVGEHGAGFGVVATEVRKLSVHTKEATINIESSLRQVQQAMKQMGQEIESIASSSNSQAELVTEFSNVIEQLNAISGEMTSFIHSFIGTEVTK